METFQFCYIPYSIIGELDFFEKSLYSFKIKVYDTEQNEGSTDIIVQVIDLPNKDPIWTRPFTSENILEKSVNVSALNFLTTRH